jgi:endonuclease YncB( thermonuclease family)
MDTIKNNLINLKSSDLELFSLNNINTFGKIVELYDGDTCKIILNNNGTLQKFSCRLLGLDTPEMKPSLIKPNRDQEILNAHKCRNRLLQLLTDCSCEIDYVMKKPECLKLINNNKKIINIKCHEFDKYGRLLVELYGDDTEKSANQILIDEGYAKSYDGGTKDVFTY